MSRRPNPDQDPRYTNRDGSLDDEGEISIQRNRMIAGQQPGVRHLRTAGDYQVEVPINGQKQLSPERLESLCDKICLAIQQILREKTKDNSIIINRIGTSLFYRNEKNHKLTTLGSIYPVRLTSWVNKVNSEQMSKEDLIQFCYFKAYSEHFQS